MANASFRVISHCLCFFILIQRSGAYHPYEDIVKVLEQYPLPQLNFDYKDYEPNIDRMTMQVHHSGHHAAYTKKMNAALKEWRASVRPFTTNTTKGIRPSYFPIQWSLCFLYCIEI